MGKLIKVDQYKNGELVRKTVMDSDMVDRINASTSATSYKVTEEKKAPKKETKSKTKNK